ncbi:hypothetical protein CPC08DRAFT_760912 [Agrocybe pediades]|nr:hypothetical protein CPC08DRAFT_760912 [Agrocybe pediades]
MKTLEDLKSFPMPPVMQYTTSPEDIFPVLNSVTWSGSLESLPKFMPFFASPSVKTLKVNTELSIDDALLFLRQYSSSSLQELEITTFVERSPTLLPDYQENVEIPGDSSILCLPHLDTLTLGSCIRLKPLFDAVHLPNLRRLELHFSGPNSSPDSDDHLPRHDFALLFSDMLAPTPTAALTRTTQNLQYVSVHFDCDDADDGEDKDTMMPAYDADQVASLIRGRLPSAYVHVEKLTPTGGSTKSRRPPPGSNMTEML